MEVKAKIMLSKLLILLIIKVKPIEVKPKYLFQIIINFCC